MAPLLWRFRDAVVLLLGGAERRRWASFVRRTPSRRLLYVEVEPPVGSLFAFEGCSSTKPRDWSRMSALYSLFLFSSSLSVSLPLAPVVLLSTVA